MTGNPTAIDWRVGRLRTLLPIAIHAVALGTALELVGDWPMAWILVVAVLVSGTQELRGWLRERRYAHTLTLVPGGIEIDSAVYRAYRAWFGPHWTAAWLKAARQRRLLYVVRGELTAANHAALRRHLKTLQLE